MGTGPTLASRGRPDDVALISRRFDGSVNAKMLLGCCPTPYSAEAARSVWEDIVTRLRAEPRLVQQPREAGKSACLRRARRHIIATSCPSVRLRSSLPRRIHTSTSKTRGSSDDRTSDAPPDAIVAA